MAGTCTYLIIYRLEVMISMLIKFSPSSVFDERDAAGPGPALVVALTLKLYEVEGLKSETSIVVVLASCTIISFEDSGPTTCILYPITACSSVAGCVQESITLVGTLCVISRFSGTMIGAGCVCVCGRGGLVMILDQVKHDGL